MLHIFVIIAQKITKNKEALIALNEVVYVIWGQVFYIELDITRCAASGHNVPQTSINRKIRDFAAPRRRILKIRGQ